MEESEEQATSFDPGEDRNRKFGDLMSTERIVHILNTKIEACRDEFFSAHPIRPEIVTKDSCCEAPSNKSENESESEYSEIEYADEVMNPIDYGTSICFGEDLAREFLGHLCCECAESSRTS